VNGRGKTEREFDALKNNFGWNGLAFSKLAQNTVFLTFTAICKNLYQYIIAPTNSEAMSADSQKGVKMSSILQFSSLPRQKAISLG